MGARMRDLGRRLIVSARQRPAAAAEAALAVVVGVVALSLEGLRGVAFVVLQALASGLLAFVRLLAFDASGTLITGALTLGKVALVTLPLGRFVVRSPRHRLAWLPVLGIVWILCLPMLFPAISTPLMGGLLVAAGGVGWALAARRRLAVIAFAPMVLAFEPALSHSPLGDSYWTKPRLAARCAESDGARPRGFLPDMAATRYFGVTAIDPNLLLLTGERGSWWLRRDEDGELGFAERSRLSGNLWEGFVSGRTVWLTKRGRVYRVTRAPRGASPGGGAHESPAPIEKDGEHRSLDVEHVIEFLLPDPPGLPIELDFADAIHDPEADVVYVSEVLRGGIRELSVVTGAMVRRTEIGGRNIQLLRRSDGFLVGIDTARLFVYEPRKGAVVESLPGGIAAMGIDLCAADDSVAVADFAGRLRLFTRSSSGAYRFDRGVALSAPRRVAFSPDCEVIAVTSGDDRTVYALRRSDLAVLHAYHVGPALRDLTFFGRRQLAVADACAASLLTLP